MSTVKFTLNKGGSLPAIPKLTSARDTSYDSEKEVNIPLDFRMICVGSTGSGKTSSALNIIKKMACFQEVHLVTKMPNEDHYEWLQHLYAQISRKTKKQHLFVYTDVSQMPLVDDFPDIPNDIPYNRLVIFDDMQGEPEKKQVLMESFFTRGRKKRFSCIYLAQNYFRCPKVIRENSNFALFRQIGSQYDINAIIKDFSLGVAPEQFEQMFREATQEHNFLLVDRFTTNPELKFRMNFGNPPK